MTGTIKYKARPPWRTRELWALAWITGALILAMAVPVVLSAELPVAI
jgi:hypothetical protein